MSPTRLTTIRDGIAPLRIYPVLVLLSFPTPGGPRRPPADRDGIPVPVLSVDGTFRCVLVEPGTRRVTFDYRPVFTYAGFGIAIAVLVVAILWAVWERRGDDLGARRRREETP